MKLVKGKRLVILNHSENDLVEGNFLGTQTGDRVRFKVDGRRGYEFTAGDSVKVDTPVVVTVVRAKEIK